MGLDWRRLGADGAHLSRSVLRARYEPPAARIARLLSAVLARPRDAGLQPSPDGLYPVRDLLALPALRGLDFLSIERAIKRHRSHHISLTYSPRNTSTSTDDETNTSWWITLRTSPIVFPPRRLVQSDESPEMVYKVPSVHWENIRQHGISRLFKPLKFSTRPIIPANSAGDHTFIRLDTQKVLNTTNYPIYSTSGHATKPRFHLYSETLTTNAPVIPPSTFKSATRVSVERFPLLLPSNIKQPTRKKRRQKGNEEEETSPAQLVVMQSGIEALEKFGCGDMLRGTKILQMWKAQEAEQSSQTHEDRVPSTPPNPRTSKPGRRLPTKDPPHSTQ